MSTSSKRAARKARNQGGAASSAGAGGSRPPPSCSRAVDVIMRQPEEVETAAIDACGGAVAAGVVAAQAAPGEEPAAGTALGASKQPREGPLVDAGPEDEDPTVHVRNYQRTEGDGPQRDVATTDTLPCPREEQPPSGVAQPVVYGVYPGVPVTHGGAVCPVDAPTLYMMLQQTQQQLHMLLHQFATSLRALDDAKALCSTLQAQLAARDVGLLPTAPATAADGDLPMLESAPHAPPHAAQAQPPSTASPDTAPRGTQSTLTAPSSVALAKATATTPGATQPSRSQPAHPSQPTASQRKPTAPVASRQPAARSQRTPLTAMDTLASIALRKQFTLHSKQAPPVQTGSALDVVSAFLASNFPSLAFTSLDAMRVNSRSIFFEVGTLAEADALVRARGSLKGSGATIREVLSNQEQQLHSQLWPQFIAARKAGKSAQFSRAVLVVDGVRVAAPPRPGRRP